MKSIDVKKLIILLATYNGENFLREQLQSFVDLNWSNIDVYASDDKSSDKTISILNEFANSWDKGKFTILTGPASGVAANFKYLIENVPDEDAYYAFSDQDDIWLPNKIKASHDFLTQVAGAALFCGRTELIAADGRTVGYSPLFKKPPCFEHAIVQSIAGGNTMVMNFSAMRLLKVSLKDHDFVAHDWWAYIVISGAGGAVYYDAEPQVKYRQHGNNLVGHNNGIIPKIKRVVMLGKGDFSRWNESNVCGLLKCKDILSPRVIIKVQDFVYIRKNCNLGGLKKLKNSGFFRQSYVSNFALYFAVLIGKV